MGTSEKEFPLRFLVTFTDPSEIAFTPTITHRPQMENHQFGRKLQEQKEEDHGTLFRLQVCSVMA